MTGPTDSPAADRGTILGHLLAVVAANLVLGALTALSVPFLWSDVRFIVLEPLGLVPGDPTANDDPTGLGLLALTILSASTWFADKDLSHSPAGPKPAWCAAVSSFVLPAAALVVHIAL